MFRLLFLLLLLLGLSSPSSPAAPPKIVLLLADDLGCPDLSFLLQSPPDIATLNIDRLAKSATYFHEANATAPICNPSKVGLIIGRYQQRRGNYCHRQGGLPKTERTIPQFLRKRGYLTKKIGKVHTNGGAAEHPGKVAELTAA
jgi:arylsulfatase A-like enzyme